RAEVDARALLLVRPHRVAYHRLEGVALWQALAQRMPRDTTVARAVHAQLSFWRAAEPVRFERDDVNRVGVARVGGHAEPEVRGNSVGNVAPRVTAVVAPVQSPVILQIEAVRPGGVSHDLVHALAELRVRIRKKLRAHSLIA